MKKITSLLSLLAFSTLLSAQSRLHLAGEARLHTYKAEYHHHRIGAGLGLTAQYDLGRSAFLESGLHLATKGGSHEGHYTYGLAPNTVREYIESKTSFTTLSLPLKFGLRFALSSRVHLTTALGPYVSMGLGGTTEVYIKDQNTGVETTGKYDVFGDKAIDKHHRFTAGLDLSVGVDINNRYGLLLGYEQGLTNLKPDAYKDRSFSLRLRYFFR